MKDEIIEEVWRNRDQLTERYGYNLEAIVRAMIERQNHPLNKIVQRSKSRKAQEPDVPKRAA